MMPLIYPIQIDTYNEESLAAEREKLRDVDPFTVIEYIKASVEILMNMKMDEQQTQTGKKMKKTIDDDLISLQSSSRKMNGDGDDASNSFQSQYEQQLQKYEAEVRNHIKIEQQLKLHIECVQDKLDDTEKIVKKISGDREEVKEAKHELTKYKDLIK